MCVVLAKYFDNIGWVGVKNRDRNYVPELTFEMEFNKKPQRLLMNDMMTGYTEGLNIHGISVLSASLQVMDDEKEIKKRTSDDNPDGERIKHALLENTIQKVVKKLIETGMTGNTIIFDQETCFLLESCNKEEQYFYQLKKIENNETVARTNHGILIPWAGYQKGINSSQTKSRESSDARLKQAEEVLKTAKTPIDLIDGIAQTPNKDPQMNSLRTTSGDKKMRTTAQEMIIPYEHTFYLRPIQSKLDIDFWKINQSKTDLWLEILSNRTLNHPEKKEHDQFTKYYSDYKDII